MLCHRREYRETDMHVDPLHFTPEREGDVVDVLCQPVGNLLRDICVRARQCYDELIVAVTRRYVVAANAAPERICDGREGAVAMLPTIAFIDGPQTIDVSHEKRIGTPQRLGFSVATACQIVESAHGKQARKFIAGSRSADMRFGSQQSAALAANEQYDQYDRQELRDQRNAAGQVRHLETMAEQPPAADRRGPETAG